MWDHPVSSASISRDYVRTLLEKHNKNKVTQHSAAHMLRRYWLSPSETHMLTALQTGQHPNYGGCLPDMRVNLKKGL